jgi:DNA polymerase-3 subunit epsilon
MLDQPIAFLDLETTGTSPARDRVIEVGLCLTEGGRLVAEWSTLVNPQVPIPPFIERYTGISGAMVATAPTFAEVRAELSRRLSGRLLVTHNAGFDYGFLQQEFARLRHPFAARRLCTVQLSRRLFPAERRHGLDAVIARHGLCCDRRHRALGDARVLWDFVQTLYRELPREAVDGAARAVLKAA